MIAPLATDRSAEHYRNEAARLRREAEAAQSDSFRHQLLVMATGYDDLAESVDFLKRRS